MGLQRHRTGPIGLGLQRHIGPIGLRHIGPIGLGLQRDIGVIGLGRIALNQAIGTIDWATAIGHGRWAIAHRLQHGLWEFSIVYMLQHGQWCHSMGSVLQHGIYTAWPVGYMLQHGLWGLYDGWDGGR